MQAILKIYSMYFHTQLQLSSFHLKNLFFRIYFLDEKMHQEGAGYLQYKCRQLRKASTDSTSYTFKRLHQKFKKYKDLYFRLCIGTAFLQYYLLFLPLSFPYQYYYIISLFLSYSSTWPLW